MESEVIMKYKVIMNNGNEHYVDFDNENYNNDCADGEVQNFVKALCSTKYIEVEEFIKVDKYKWRKRKILLSTRNINEIVVP
jgi:hypothetical protein